jgi:H+/gluconate symporter-like permease
VDSCTPVDRHKVEHWLVWQECGVCICLEVVVVFLQLFVFEILRFDNVQFPLLQVTLILLSCTAESTPPLAKHIAVPIAYTTVHI